MNIIIIIYVKIYVKNHMNTSWGWAVPISAQLKLARTNLELHNSYGCLLSLLCQGACVSYSLEYADTGWVDEIVQLLEANYQHIGVNSASCDFPGQIQLRLLISLPWKKE